MATSTTYPHIIKENGVPARLENHPRLRVSMIVAQYLAYGRSPDEICLHLPHLHPGEVYSAMAYYFDHQEEIDSEIQAELEQLDRDARKNALSPIHAKLRAKGLLGG